MCYLLALDEGLTLMFYNQRDPLLSNLSGIKDPHVTVSEVARVVITFINVFIYLLFSRMADLLNAIRYVIIFVGVYCSTILECLKQKALDVVHNLE